MTKTKADSHGDLADYWGTVHNFLNLTLIFLSAATTVTTLLPVSDYVPAGIGALTTLVSAISGFMAPSNKRQAQMEACRTFRALQLKMIRCETEAKYEELWQEYNQALLTEPFLPKKYKKIADTDFTMSPEFVLLVAKKEADVAGELVSLLGSEAAAEVATFGSIDVNKYQATIKSEEDDDSSKTS